MPLCTFIIRPQGMVSIPRHSEFMHRGKTRPVSQNEKLVWLDMYAVQRSTSWRALYSILATRVKHHDVSVEWNHSSLEVSVDGASRIDDLQQLHQMCQGRDSNPVSNKWSLA